MRASSCYCLRRTARGKGLQDESGSNHNLSRQEEHHFGDPGERADSKPGEQERQIRRYGNHRGWRIEILPHDPVEGVRPPPVIALLLEKASRRHGMVVIDEKIRYERAPSPFPKYGVVQGTLLTAGPPKTLVKSSRSTDDLRAVGDII